MAKAAPDRGHAPPPAKLPFCGDDIAKEPLVALCRVGEPPERAHFACDDPEALTFCGGHTTFSCRYRAFAGEEPPPITFSAIHDEEGPKLDLSKGVTEMPPEKEHRTSPIRGVEVEWRDIEPARGETMKRELAERITSWGCVQIEDSARTLFDCGAWQASIYYLDITKTIDVTAAEPGIIGCVEY